MPEKCVNVYLGDDREIRAICRQATKRAIFAWREEGLDKTQIGHVVTHKYPGIPPSFAEPQEVEIIRRRAEASLGASVEQVDGLRRDGLVNVLKK